MRVVAIIQARMGSTRLPGKVLRDIGGMPMLARVVRRVQRAKLIEQVVVATSTEDSDAPIIEACASLGVQVTRGSETDVLDRYYQAAQRSHAEAVVRITADCPLIDPGVMDQVIAAFLDKRPDYASNIITRTYPRGLDTEVMMMTALERAWKAASESYQRIHVTPYFYQNPQLFHLLAVTGDEDYSQQRWTVDTVEDLTFVQEIYSRMGNRDDFTWREVLTLIQDNPMLVKMNADIRQKSLHEG
mgnify:CR=1 FL=1